MTLVFKLSQDLTVLSEDVYNRVHPETLWNDLWSESTSFDAKIQAENDDYSLESLLSRTDEPKGIPAKLIFFGWFDLLDKTELPVNSFGWTIISKRFLEVVKELGFTDYRLIHLRVIERAQFDNIFTEPNIRKYEDDATVQGLRYDDELFYGFQVLPRVRLLTDDSDKTNRMGKKVIWRDDVAELPFFFRESRFLGSLLVNQEARDALEKAGIRGLRFTPAFE
jgi:hypothetical protein